MRNVRLVRQYQAIQSLIERTRVATSEDIELQSHWGKYLCVLSAGLLENSIRVVYSEFANNSSSPQVAKYAGTTLGNVYTPRASRFLEVAKSFSNEWGQSLEEYLDANNGERRNAIDSIMNNRHQIAHGRDTSISVVRVKDYLNKAVEVIDFIESQCRGR